MSSSIKTLEDGLKIIGLLTPDARNKILQAFIRLERENNKLHAEIVVLRTELTALQNRVDKLQDTLIKAGSGY